MTHYQLRIFIIWKTGDRKHPFAITSITLLSMQGLLELLWTVYSERKLKSCLKLRNFQNPFNKDKSVGLQKRPKICMYRGSPDNTVSISTVPSLTRIFSKKIARIPRFSTGFIRKSHFNVNIRAWSCSKSQTEPI